MFPNLRTLMLANNELFSWSPDASPTPAGRPAVLPKSWTQSSYPVAFPAMAQLVLFPRNDFICSLPNATNSQVAYANINEGEDRTVQPGTSGPMPLAGHGGACTLV